MNIDYQLFSGEDIHLDCGLTIKQHSIHEIEKNIGYKEYQNLIWIMTRYAYEFKFDFEDSGIDYSNFTTYDTFIVLSRSMNIKWEELILKINFIFDDDFKILDGYLTSKNGIRIDNTTIEEIKSIFERMMFYKKPKERKPANEEAKEMIKKQIKWQSKQKVKYNIYSIMYGLVGNSNCSETFETMTKRTIHQIYALHRYIGQNKEFDNTIDGIYAGVIDKKNVNFDKINWINIID